MSGMPIYDGKGDVILTKEKKGPGRPKKEPAIIKPNIKIKTLKTFTFYEYMRNRLDLSFVADMFNAGKGSVAEWDIMVQALCHFYKSKINGDK